MKRRLLDLLVCPWCAGSFEMISFDREETGEVTEGCLTCGCGRVFPIVNSIPRILTDAFDQFAEFGEKHRSRLPQSKAVPAPADRNAEAIRRTRASFGYQWTVFSEMKIDFRENFLGYIHPVEESFFPGKLGLDLGCGFGRHIYNAARFGAEMVGVDLSDAIESARQNTRDLPNVHLVQADVYALPFRPATFDFAYSIGVLHHLPDPEGGFRALVPAVKPGGSMFIWVYSKTRSALNALLESVRPVTTRLPRRGQMFLSFVGATVDWLGFIVPYRMVRSLPVVGHATEKLMADRIKLYSAYPFQVVYADWFDRLAAPIRFYYDDRDLNGWLERARLDHTVISPTGMYGWRAYGERP